MPGWTVTALSLLLLSKRALGESTPSTEKEALERLLIYRGTWGMEFNMTTLPDGGRQIPWPMVSLAPNQTMNSHISEKVTGQTGHHQEPQLTISAYEGEAIKIPSGVGKWAKPKEAVWMRDRRILWQHTPDRPDWMDHRDAAKFTINYSYDLEIPKATTRDEGRYTSKFQLQKGGPIYTMEIDVHIHRLPDPKIYTDRTQPSARRLTIRPNETEVEMRCRAIGKTRQGTIMGWTKDGLEKVESRVIAEGEHTETSIEATQDDDGALFTCFTTHNDTRLRKTTTIRIRTTHGRPQPSPDLKNRRETKMGTTQKGDGNPGTPKGDLAIKVALFVSATVTVSTIVVWSILAALRGPTKKYQRTATTA